MDNEAGVYPADSGITDPRAWDQVRADTLAAVRAAGIRKTAGIVGAVLDLLGEEALNRMAAELMADTRLKAMDVRNGGSIDVEPSRELVALWVGAARGILGVAENYAEIRVDLGIDLGLADPPAAAEMTVKVAEDPERFVFRLQRAGKLTPHEARNLAEERADAAEAALTLLTAAPPREVLKVTEWGVRRPDLQSGVFSTGCDESSERMARLMARDQARRGIRGALLCRVVTYPEWEELPEENTGPPAALAAEIEIDDHEYDEGFEARRRGDWAAAEAAAQSVSWRLGWDAAGTPGQPGTAPH